MTKGRNSEFNWDWPPGNYIKDNYQNLIKEDRRLGRAAIGSLIETELPLGAAKRAVVVGIGDDPRGSAIIAPFMASREEGARIDMGDIGEKKIAATRETMRNLALGNLGIWQAHQDHLASVDPRWADALRKAAKLGVVQRMDMHELPPSFYDIGVAEHVFESSTSFKDEWEEVTQKFLRSVKPEVGVVYMAYMMGSNGYTVDGVDYPAYPLRPGEVETLAAVELRDFQNFYTTPSHQAREKDDDHHYEGMGVLVGIRK